jgi:hypothetical protein
MTVEQAIRWATLLVAVISAAYGIIITAGMRPSGPARTARGFFVWPNILSAVLALLTILALVIFGARPMPYLSKAIVAAFFIGWSALFLLFFASRFIGRKLSASGGEGHGRDGYLLISASGLLSASAALLGAGIVESPVLKTTVESLLALPLGFWLAASFWSLPSVLYRGLLAHESDAASTDVAPFCAQFRSAPGEVSFLLAAMLTTSAAMGSYHYPEPQSFGLLFPLASFAASLVFSMVILPLFTPRRDGRRSWIIYLAGVLIFFAGSLLPSYFLAVNALGDIRAFLSFSVGLGTALVMILTARFRPPFRGPGSPFGREIAVSEVLLVLGAAVLSFRWLGGYGMSLAGVGFLSSLGMAFPLGALWASAQLGDEPEESDLTFMAHAASRFAEVIMAGGAFLLAVVLTRLFTERMHLGDSGIDISDPYPLIGLVLGAIFPVILRAAATVEHERLYVKAASFLRQDLLSLGRWATFRSLSIWIIAGVVPLLLGFFWRAEASGAFLVGIAASELFLILTLWLGEARSTVTEGIRLATRSAHILAVGSGLVTAILVPPLIQSTADVTRHQKIWVLLALLAVVFIATFITIWRRLAAEPETGS